MDSENYYIELSDNPIRFEPVSKLTNVFYDEPNRQVCVVRSGGATGVVIKGIDGKTNVNFRMDDRGEVISIKLSPSMKILAIQRSSQSVEFTNFSQGMDTAEYSQSCKGKNSKIIGFNWVSNNEIVFITDHGIEYFQIIPEKKSLRAMKSYSVPINWFIWMYEESILLLSTGTLGNTLLPFIFRGGNVSRLSKVEVDVVQVPKPPKICLLERDVTISKIYDLLYIVVLRHQTSARLTGAVGAEIALYQLQKEGPAKKTDVLRLETSGRFAINVVDNLILVHHQASKTSMLFDIHLDAYEESGGVRFHHPALSPLPLRPVTLKLQGLPSSSLLPAEADYPCALYSPNWIIFQPDVVIDAKLGCLWTLRVHLDPLLSMMPDKLRLVELLLQRREARRVVLTVCAGMLPPGQQAPLTTFAGVWNKLNGTYREYQDAEAAAVQGGLDKTAVRRRYPVVIEQSDMYTHVFSSFPERKDIKPKFMISVLVEYVRSLNQFQIPVQHYLFEILINLFDEKKDFYQLHQFLQYHVFSDSKQLACVLLSLESQYQPAYQLALDMLKRIGTAHEEIIEVLLSKGQLLTALRFVKSVGAMDSISARKFLEAAKIAEDETLFYTVFKLFEQRNVRLRNNHKFAAGEHCQPYVQHFEQLFGAEAFGAGAPV